MSIAITRDVSPAIARCELTHLARTPIDFELARVQHERYRRLLEELGCEVRRLPADADLPDSIFVEDAAVVLDEIAVLARPGAESRRSEVPVLSAALGEHRELVAIEAPATLDGGDVLRIGRTLYVGRSRRTSHDGVERLGELVAPHGYSVVPVAVSGCLHLKSAATLVAAGVVLVNPRWIDAGTFADLGRIEIDPAEPFGANALHVGDSVVYPTAFPATRRRLEDRGCDVRTVDVSEIARAEGGVTCCSLVFDP